MAGRTNAARMLLELTDFESELERLLGSNMPGHGGGSEKPEPEPEPEDEEPEEQDPA